jgi:hypothetical protein
VPVRDARAATGRWLWIAAVVLTVVAAGWQRRTGPSYDFRTTVLLNGVPVGIVLPRTGLTTSPSRVSVQAWGTQATGTLHWRRYPTDEPFTSVPLTRDGDELAARLPVQPPAGKVEYALTLRVDTGSARIPADGARAIILRFRRPVPIGVLGPHIAVMFLAMLVGVRAGLGAAVDEPGYGTLTGLTLAGITVGGLILGPVTQEYAFGAYWTGIPFGWDVTDNKTLIMWVGWMVAGLGALRRLRATRRLVVFAAVLMLATYLVPHSVRGSQLDYTHMPHNPEPAAHFDP